MVLRMENNYLVSVVIPVYNSEKFINNTLKSIVNTNFIDYEVILIDDGSTDNSIQVCRDFIYKYDLKNIKIITQSNSGVSSARNRGISEATGKYIYFMDSDDEVLENMFRDFSKVSYEHECDILIGGVEINNNGIIKYQTVNDAKVFENYDEVTDFLNSMDVSDKLWYMNVVWNKWFKRDIIIRNNIFFKQICPGEDYEFVANYFKYAERVFIGCNPVYRYYIRNNTNSLLHKKYDLESSIKRRKICWKTTLELIEKRKLIKRTFEISEGYSLYSCLYYLIKFSINKNESYKIICEFLKMKQYYTIHLYFLSLNGIFRHFEGAIFKKKKHKKIYKYFKFKLFVQKLFKK